MSSPPTPTPLFNSLHARLDALLQAYELGTAPLPLPPAPDPDRDLWIILEDPDCIVEAQDNLKQRAGEVRVLLNDEWRSILLSSIPLLTDDSSTLRSGPSLIPAAGLGLFTSAPISSGSTICHYVGDLHSIASFRSLPDRSYGILLPLAPSSSTSALPTQTRDVIVDPSPLPAYAPIPARFANDPRSPAATNCRFQPDLKCLWARMVATRDIEAGGEVYVDYGDAYWDQHQGGAPSTLTGTR
jgi:hypothetical protein